MGKDVVAVEQKLEKVIPKEFKVDVHHWLILGADFDAAVAYWETLKTDDGATFVVQNQ